MIYENGSAILVWKKSYRKTFECHLDLSQFPFDIHLCKIIINIEKTITETPKWNINHIKARNDASELLQYNVSKLRYYFPNNDSSCIYIYLIFQRHYNSHILTMFLPCFIIIAIAQITVVMFPLENFTDKITVTLSLLIVVTTLFAQSTTSFPETSQIKLIECFFFYCISRLFTIFLLHSFVGFINRKSRDKTIYIKKIKLAKMYANLQNKKCFSCKLNMTSNFVNKSGFYVGVICDLIMSIYFLTQPLISQKEIIEKFKRFSEFDN